MRGRTVLAVALGALLAPGGVAGAQTVTGSVTPKKAGTTRNPLPATVNVGLTIDPATKVTAQRLTYTFPRTIILSGKGYKFCTQRRIIDRGADSCSKRSKVGEGTAVLYAGATRVDFAFDVYVASAKRLTLALSSSLLTTTLPATIQKRRTLVVDVSPQLQQPVPGLFTTLERFDLTLGAKPVKHKQTPTSFAQTAGCRRGRHPVGITLDVAAGAPLIAGAVDLPCRKRPRRGD